MAQVQSHSASLPAVLQTQREDTVLHLLGDASAHPSNPGISPQMNERPRCFVSCSQVSDALRVPLSGFLMDLCGFWSCFLSCNRKGCSLCLVSEKLMATSSRAHLQSFSSEMAESCHAWSSVGTGAVSAQL